MRIQSNAMFRSLLVACLAAAVSAPPAEASVLVPTYVLPPAAFRDPRSLPPRTLARLAGGHLRLPPLYDSKDSKGDHAKNSFAYVDKDAEDHGEKDAKNYDDKFAGVVVKQEQTAGWNQGQWDDGMLMSSAGNGKEKGKKTADVDEDKKTLADQVAEGKYGLIQKELFLKMPTRPGVISYAVNPETQAKDNEGTLGGLKNDEIWLAEDQLLVLRGGALGDKTREPAWPPIDDYQAPPRQVKVPPNPAVPPPFPVRLSDGGPLVFLTPNGSIPAPLFPALPPPAGLGALLPAPFPYPPAGAPPGAYPGNLPPGGAPLPRAPGSVTPRNESEPPFPFLGPNPGSLAGGNVSELYDEDDPSIYYPPPYSFSYRADNSSRVPAGPLVPGIVLPPPPDFFGPLEPTPAGPAPHAYPATPAAPPTAVLRPTSSYLPARPLPDSPNNGLDVTTEPPPKTVTITSRPASRQPERVVVISKAPTRKPYSPSVPAQTPAPVVPKARPAVTVLHKRPKTTLKPVPGSLYDYPEKNFYDGNSVSPSPQPFLVYGPPERTRVKQFPEEGYVTSTPVPLRAYYSDANYENVLSQVQYAKPSAPDTRVRPDFYSQHNSRQNGKSVASFYFYEEPVKPASTPAPATYFDGRNYYHTVGANGQALQDGYYYSSPVQGGFSPPANLEYRPIPSRDPSPFFFIPQRQGSRTLTQEYFSVQKPKTQSAYVQQALPAQPIRANGFYDQIANIKQTIDYYTTHRPKVNVNLYRPNQYREIRPKAKPAPRPVYQFSFQNNEGRPEHDTFRAPKMDDTEPFRPMVAYSEPYDIKEDYVSTPKTAYAVEKQKISTEKPLPSKFFTTVRPEDYDYEDASRETKNTVRASQKPPVVSIRQHAVTPASGLKSQRGPNPTTRNPVNHAYYTKQEEGLFDDITKNYFTIFGQKIEPSNSDGVGIAVTAPIRPIEVSTIKTPIDNGINIRYVGDDQREPLRQEQPVISLAGDTQVNYRQPRPLVNPDSEFIPIVNPQIQAKYEAEQQIKQLREQISHRQRAHNVEIIKSEGVEQQQVKEGQQFGADQLEYFRPLNQGGQSLQTLQRGVSGGYTKLNPGRGQVAEGRPGSLIAYRLPGEGAHVYFLTPQPARPDTLKYRTAEEIAALS